MRMLFVEMAVCVYFVYFIPWAHTCICVSVNRLILKQIRLGKVLGVAFCCIQSWDLAQVAANNRSEKQRWFMDLIL